MYVITESREGMMMEKKLKSMMDFQKFENDPRLAKLIAETENRWSGRAIEDDDLDMVFAARGQDEVNALLSAEKHDKK